MDLIKHEIQDEVIQTAEPVSNRKSINMVIKIIAITYERADIFKVISSATQLNP